MILNRNVIRGIRFVFVDFLALAVGVINGFFLPVVFGIESYAFFKVFSLYAAYAVVFSFGFADGLYLKYGGKNEKEINRAEIKAHYFFVIKFQTIVFLLMYCISFAFIKDEALILFVFFVFPVQIIHFFRLYYRATGEFDRYTILQATLIFFEFLNTFFFVFILKKDNPELFIRIKIINHIIVAVIFSLLFLLKIKGSKTVKIKMADYKKIIKPGIIVLGADMLMVMLLSVDRWFVMIFFDNENFAYYSFAVSVFTLFIVFITSVSNIFYSYISRRIADNVFIGKLHGFVALLGVLSWTGYIIIKIIVENFIPAYKGSLTILFMLMISLPFIALINIVYINIYKASKNIGMYLQKMAVVVIISFVFNSVAVYFFRKIFAVSCAAVFSYIVCFMILRQDYKKVIINDNKSTGNTISL